MPSNEYSEIEQKIAAAVSDQSSKSKVLPKASFFGKLTESCRTQSCGELLDKALDWSFYAVIFLMPLFFLPWTSELLELNKQALLLVGALLIAVLYTAKLITSNAVEMKKSHVYVGVGAVVAAALAAASMSQYPFQSYFGIDGQEFLSAATYIGAAIFLFVGSQHFSASRISSCINALFASSAIASIVGFLQLAGVFVIPFDLTKSQNFNPIGLVSLWAAFSAITLLLAIMRLIQMSAQEKKAKVQSALLILLTIVNLFVLIAVDDSRVWLGLAAGLAFSLVVLVTKLPKEKKVGWLAVPGFLVVFALVMSFVNTPRFIFTPIEVFPTVQTSFDIASKTVGKSPLTGYGQGNFVNSYTEFKPIEINNEDGFLLWGSRIDQAGSLLATKMAGTGVLGLLAFALLIILMGIKVVKSLKHDEVGDDYLLLLGASASLVSMGVFYVLKPGNMTIMFTGWLLITFVIALTARNSRALLDSSNNHLITSSIVFSILLLGGATGMYFYIVGRYLPDVAYLNALRQDAELSTMARSGKEVKVEDVDKLIARLLSTVSGNAVLGTGHHGYPRALSQALLYKLGILVGQKDSKTETIAPVAADAVEAAKAAVAINPFDGRNYYNLALIYSSLTSFDPAAAQFAIDNYEKAMALEPTNPVLPLELGRVYFDAGTVFATQAQQLKLKDDKGADRPEVKAQQTTLMAESEKAFTKAGEYYTKAVTLKKNYAPAYFQLAVLSIRNNNKDEARTYLDKALQYNLSLVDLRVADQTLFYSIGLGYNTIEDLSGAQTAFIAAQSLAPDYPLALWQLLLIAQQQGKKEDAIKIAEYLLKADPENKLLKDKLTELKAPPPTPTPAVAPAPTAPAKPAPAPTKK